MSLAHLSNEALLSDLSSLVAQGRVVLARLLDYLGEVEDRRLDLEVACSSLFDFCVRPLGMSEDEACRRVSAARLVRRFPIALGMIERGEFHLTTLLLLRDHLTDDDHEELLSLAKGATKSELQHRLAARFPRPDVPSRVVPLAEEGTLTPQGCAAPPLAAPARSRVEPLSPERYKVQFTASAELREKLERATDLLRHRNPTGNLSEVAPRAVDLLLAKLEKERLGKTTRAPRKPPANTERLARALARTL